MMYAVTRISERRACVSLGLSRPVLHHLPRVRPANQAYFGSSRKQAETERRRFGYRRLHVLPRLEDIEINQERAYRLHREAGPTVRTPKSALRSLTTMASDQ